MSTATTLRKPGQTSVLGVAQHPFVVRMYSQRRENSCSVSAVPVQHRQQRLRLSAKPFRTAVETAKTLCPIAPMTSLGVPRRIPKTHIVKPQRKDKPTEFTAAQRMQNKLNTFSLLQPNWDSYSAPAPSERAIRNAKSLLHHSMTRGLLPEDVLPSAMGGIGISFVQDDREVWIELYNNGTAHALFANDRSAEETTKAVETSSSGFRGFLIEASTFLHVKPSAQTR